MVKLKFKNYLNIREKELTYSREMTFHKLNRMIFAIALCNFEFILVTLILHKDMHEIYNNDNNINICYVKEQSFSFRKYFRVVNYIGHIKK